MSQNHDDETHLNSQQTLSSNSTTSRRIPQTESNGYFTLNDLGEYEELYDPFGDTFTADENVRIDAADTEELDDDEGDYELSKDTELETDNVRTQAIPREYEIELCIRLETAEVTVMRSLLNTLFGSIYLIALFEKVRSGHVQIHTVLRDYKVEFAQRHPTDVKNAYLNLTNRLRHHVAAIIDLNRQLHAAMLEISPTVASLKLRRDQLIQNMQLELQSVNLSRKYAHDLYDAFKDLYKRLEAARHVIAHAERITGASYREIGRISQAIEAGELSADFTQNTRPCPLNYIDLNNQILDAIDAIRSIELSFHGSAESIIEIQKMIAAPLRAIGQAKDQLFCANQRLVSNIAKKYENQGLDMEDLIQEGGCGLLKAIDRFEYRRGNRLATYAIWWIRQTISRAIIDSSRTVRLPNHVASQLKKIIDQMVALSTRLGHSPSLEELAANLDLPEKIIEQLMPFAHPPESLDSVISAHPTDYTPGHSVKSLLHDSAENLGMQGNIVPAIMEYTTDAEDQYRNDAEKTLADTLEDPDRDDPLQNLIRRELTEQIVEIEKHLTDKEKTILNLRYGLNGETEHTLEQIGQIYNVTRERIRQIEEKALARLKHPVRIDKLKPYHET